MIESDLSGLFFESVFLASGVAANSFFFFVEAATTLLLEDSYFWRMAICGSQLLRWSKASSYFTAVIVLLDHICNFECLRRWGSSLKHPSMKTRISFQSPWSGFNSCRLLALNSAWWQNCHFLSSTHLLKRCLLSNQPDLLPRPLQWFRETGFFFFFLNRMYMHVFVCLAYVQHVYMFALCAPMLQPCFLQLHTFNLPANSQVHL